MTPAQAAALRSGPMTRRDAAGSGLTRLSPPSQPATPGGSSALFTPAEESKIPTAALVAGGVLLVGGAAYFLLRKKR